MGQESMLTALMTAALLAPAEPSPIALSGMLVHPRRLLVKAHDPAALRDIARSGARVVRRIPQIGYVVVETPAGSLQATRTRLRAIPGVGDVSLDRAAKPAYVPNDPYWNLMWHPQAVKADLAWDISLGTNLPVVAILDTGVFTGHPDLAANIWQNLGEIAGNGVDDDGNGYVDDRRGYDFANNDADPSDDNGHGTACAGLAAAVGNNGEGAIGMAPRARIMALKVATAGGLFYASATVPAYVYAADMGARIASMSYYADSVVPAEEVALRYAHGKGVLPIAAAGNDQTVYPYFPGAYEFVMAVAAVDTSLGKAWFSDWGSWVDISAPGVSLVTSTSNGGYTNAFGGTSGATPIVAGIAALMMGANPAATSKQVRTALEDTAAYQNQAPYGEISNYGLVDAQAAVRAITGTAAPRKPSVVRWVSPIGSVPTGQSAASWPRALVYGRTLDGAAAVVANRALPRLAIGRDRFETPLPGFFGTWNIRINAKTVASLVPPLKGGYVYPLIEASAPGAEVVGGFAETLRRDGILMTCTPSGNRVGLQGAFKNLPKAGAFDLAVVRRITSPTPVAERLMLYDWKTASYPYASFVTVKTAVVKPTFEKAVARIPDLSRFVDFNGNVYLRIEAGDLPVDAFYEIDQAYLVPVPPTAPSR